MIVSIAKATNSHGARIRYAADPAKGGEFVASNIQGAEHNPAHAIDTLERVSALRPARTKPSAHFSLRARDDEHLSREQWAEIAEMAASRLGFGTSPWVAYLHHDKGAPHLHVVAAYVTFDGETVRNSWDRLTAMHLAREVETRFELTPLATPDRAPKQRRQGEFHNAAEITPRLYLQTAIVRARDESRDFPAFAASLEREQIRVTLARTNTGRVLGLSYEYGGAHFSGSQLGRAYAWPAIRQTVELRPEHEQQNSPRERPPAHDRAERSQASGRPERPRPPPPDESRQTIAAHLAALGAERYTVVILDRENPSRITRSNWSAADVEHAAPFLRAHNERGAEILIRPFPPPVALTLTDGQLATARELGLTPAAVVRTGADSSDVWFRAPRDLEPAEHRALAAALVRDLGATPDRTTNLAHLAGFLVRTGDVAQLADQAGARLPAAYLAEPQNSRPAPIVEAALAQAFHSAGLPWPAEPPAALRPETRPDAAPAVPTVETYREHLTLLLHRPEPSVSAPIAPPELVALAQAVEQHAALLDTWHRRLQLVETVNADPRPRPEIWAQLAQTGHDLRVQTTTTATAYRAAGTEPLVPLPAPPLSLRQLANASEAPLPEIRLAARLETYLRNGDVPPPVRADRLRALTPQHLLERAEIASNLAHAAIARYRADPTAEPRPLAVALDRALAYHREIGRRADLPREPTRLATHLTTPPKAHHGPYLAAHARSATVSSRGGNLLATVQKNRARARHLARPHEIPTAAVREAAKLAIGALPGPSLLKQGPFAAYDALRVDRSAPLKLTLFAETALRSALAATGIGGTAASLAAAAIFAVLKLIPKIFEREEDQQGRHRGPTR